MSVDEYLEAIQKSVENVRANIGVFWLKYEYVCPELPSYAKKVLTVPASSTAVERVFSVGGAIFNFSSMSSNPMIYIYKFKIGLISTFDWF